MASGVIQKDSSTKSATDNPIIVDNEATSGSKATRPTALTPFEIDEAALLTKYPRQVKYNHLKLLNLEFKEPVELDVIARLYGQFSKKLEIRSRCHPGLISKFPNVEQLLLYRLTTLQHFQRIPKTIKALEFKIVDQVIDNQLLRCLKSIQNLKTIKFKKMRVRKMDVCNRNSLSLFLVELSPAMHSLVSSHPGLFHEISLNIDIYEIGTMIEPENVTQIHGSHNLRDFGWLHNFPNLEIFCTKKLYSYRGLLDRDDDHFHCCKFHEALVMPKMLELQLKTNDQLCDTCFDAILQSFPNLTKFVLTGRISNSQLYKLVASLPNLTCLTINCNSLNEEILQKNPDRPNIERLVGLETFEVLDKLSYKLDSCNGAKFMTGRTLKLWPLMWPESLTHLNLNEVTLLNNETLTDGLISLTISCPNIEHFQVRCSIVFIQDLEVIAKGWHNLQTLNLSIEGIPVMLTGDGFSKTFGQFSNNLKRLTVTTPFQWCRDDDVMWQFKLYERNTYLDFIRLIDKSKNFDFGTVRSDYVNLLDGDSQMRFGVLRAEYRDIYNEYPPWTAKDIVVHGRCDDEQGPESMSINYSEPDTDSEAGDEDEEMEITDNHMSVDASVSPLRSEEMFTE